MPSAAFLGLISTVITAVAYLCYFRSIIKSEHGSRPSRMTWLLLSTISWIVAANSYIAEATDTLSPLLMNAVGSTVVFTLSLRHGVGGWERVDKIAFACAVLIFLFSIYINQPLISLVLALSFDLFALMPTMVKLYGQPTMEEASPWILTVLANVLNVLALGILTGTQNSLEVLLPPIYFLGINGVVLLLIVLPRQQ